MMVLCPNGHPNRAGAKFCSTCRTPLTTSPFFSTTLPVNTLLHGRYTIVRWVGGGGMGAVYEALDNRIAGRRVAVKELNTALVTDPQVSAMFQQGAQMLTQLNHPNLPKVSDYFVEGSKQYLVMDFIIGRTLEKVLEDNRAPLSEAQVVGVGIQLCNVLEYLHACQPPIIFRDLKPANIMLDSANHIKLIDFGIARLYKPGKGTDTSPFGSVGYAPPEQYGRGQTDARSDIYALCVTLYHLLTRYDPALNPFNLPPLQTLNPAVSPNLIQIISNGMHPDPNKRWQTARELGAALRQHQPGKVAGGTSRITTRLILKAAELSPAQLAIAIALLLLTSVVGAWFLTPILVNYPLIWGNLDFIALVAPLVFAATRRPYLPGIANALIGTVGAWIIWTRLGYETPWVYILVNAMFTGILIEVWLSLLERIKGHVADAWQRELAWLALLAVIVTVLWHGIAGIGAMAQPGLWFVSALLGTFGWFIGDLIQQYLFLKQQGLRRVGHF